MITSLECIPCLVRQTLDATRMVGTDEVNRELILRKVLQLLGETDFQNSPPAIAQQIHRIIREATGVADPYQQIKEQLNRTAMDLYPELKRSIALAGEPLIKAIRLAIAGNAIDMGVNGNLKLGDVYKIVDKAMEEPFHGDVDEFKQALKQANSILYLADNCGEIVFDRILIEEINPARVTLAVRGGAVINDATITDAKAAGLDKIVSVINNGSDAPGTLIDDCSSEFRKIFFNADLIISKGQGNYESLNTVNANIFFLFKIKCPLIKEHMQQPVGTQVLVRTKGNNRE